MSFDSPLYLLALAAVPLALLAYAVTRRRARRYAVRFPGVPGSARTTTRIVPR